MFGECVAVEGRSLLVQDGFDVWVMASKSGVEFGPIEVFRIAFL